MGKALGTGETQLDGLGLGDNAIGDEGAEAIAQGLPNSQVRLLHLFSASPSFVMSTVVLLCCWSRRERSPWRCAIIRPSCPGSRSHSVGMWL